jgi:hypothetical protein
MRKANEDATARTAAEVKIGDALTGYTDTTEQAAAHGRTVLGEFKAVEFETTTRKVGDDEIHLRRLVITGPWEVDTGKH